jgi:superfamily II DNA or RNA helicase
MDYSLYPYQQTHFERLMDIFSKHKIAIDCSKTGSGKTIVALKIAKHFLDEPNEVVYEKAFIICPPTLVDQWKKYISKDYSSRIEVYSAYSIHKIKIEKNKNYFLIVDECHLFKNEVQRTQKLKRITRNVKKALMISATPYDDTRQYTNIQRIFEIEKEEDLKDHLSAMQFDYTNSVHYSYFHIPQEEEQDKKYQSGYKNIMDATRPRKGDLENSRPTFNPKLFSAGIQKIHDSLNGYLIEYVKKLLEDEPTHKFVIVLNYVRHFEAFTTTFENVLVLNGEIKMSERKEIISKFQQNDLQHRIICISAEVGSVGIELDDKTGDYPRHMIVLPTTNGISFCQSIGRIQRTLTKSDSKVSVIQPMRMATYFKMQVKRKFSVLDQFIHTPKFELQVDHHTKEGCPFADQKIIGDYIGCKCFK